MAASATAALAQEAAEQSAGPAVSPLVQDSQGTRHTKPSRSAKKARQRQRKQVATCASLAVLWLCAAEPKHIYWQAVMTGRCD